MSRITIGRLRLRQWPSTVPIGLAVGLVVIVIVVALAVLMGLAILARSGANWAVSWYQTTPPGERMVWGGLAAAFVLAMRMLIDRTMKLRESRVLPEPITSDWPETIANGQKDRDQAIADCEAVPSPAGRIALAALGRWGRPTAEIEQAVTLAKQVEIERLGENIGSLRRIAALAPMIGFFGSLLALGRTLSALGAVQSTDSWGPALAPALAPLTTGVGLAILALLAFDGLTSQVETLTAKLSRLEARLIEAIVTQTEAEAQAAAAVIASNARPDAAHWPVSGPSTPKPKSKPAPDPVSGPSAPSPVRLIASPAQPESEPEPRYRFQPVRVEVPREFRNGNGNG